MDRTSSVTRGFCLLLSAPTLAQAALFHQTIQTESGPVYGYPEFNSTPAGNLTNWQDIAVWKGIPFAASTAGEVSTKRFSHIVQSSGRDKRARIS